MWLIFYIRCNCEELPSYAEYQERNKPIKISYLLPARPLPSYREYLQQKSENFSSTSSPIIDTTEKTKDQTDKMVQDSPQWIHFPTIQLCKDTPKQDSTLYYIYCYALLGLYFGLVFIFVIWQIRRHCPCEAYSLSKKRARKNRDGYESDQQYNGIELGDPKILQRMLPK